MNPEKYAWNNYERRLYIDEKIIVPSPYKIKIVDDFEKRVKLEKLLNNLPQKELAIWARNNAERFIKYINIGDEKIKNDIIIETSNVLNRRIEDRISLFELRKAGFLANNLSKSSVNDISKFSSRVYSQAIATGHMRGHALVSSDYAIKVVNILSNNDIHASIIERSKQIELVKNIIDKL